MTTSDRTQLRCEIAALDADQMHFLLLLLAGSDPDAVRHALDVERATRAAERAEVGR